MNKLAFFVEGQTEQIFIEKFLIEIAGKIDIEIEKYCLIGKRRRIHLKSVDGTKRYFVYIIDSHNDTTVKSDIVENYDNLVKNGYTSIIGIRDVYPVDRDKIDMLRRGLMYKVKTTPIVPIFILSVMEIEAWFLAEHTHYQRIHSCLTTNRIKEKLGFDPSTDDMSLRNCPSNDLHNIYSLEKMAYTKRKKQTNRTVEALDYAEIYVNHGDNFRDVKILVDEINKFIS